MATYTTLTDASFDVGKPITQAQGLALKDNPVAIAERASGAPIMSPSTEEYKTTGTAATWNLPDPDNMTTFKVIVTGGGGSGDSVASGGNGSASTFTYDGYTVTGGGGVSGYATPVGGTATNGNLNIKGGQGDLGGGSASGNYGNGGASYWGGQGAYGSGGVSANKGENGGGAGGTAIYTFTVDPAVTSATYTVGAGGVDASSGLIVIVY